MKYSVGDLVIGNELATETYGLTKRGVVGRVQKVIGDDILINAFQDKYTTINIAIREGASGQTMLSAWYNKYATSGFWVDANRFDPYCPSSPISLSEYIM